MGGRAAMVSITGKAVPVWLATVALGSLFFLSGYSLLCLLVIRTDQPVHSPEAFGVQPFLVLGTSLVLAGLVVRNLRGRAGRKDFWVSFGVSVVVAASLAGAQILSRMAFVASSHATYIALADEIRETSVGGELQLPPNQDLLVYSSSGVDGKEILRIKRNKGIMAGICGLDLLGFDYVSVELDSERRVVRVWADLF